MIMSALDSELKSARLTGGPASKHSLVSSSLLRGSLQRHQKLPQPAEAGASLVLDNASSAR
jgi:hypothetical protein